jgi:hypothetical protein
MLYYIVINCELFKRRVLSRMLQLVCEFSGHNSFLDYQTMRENKTGKQKEGRSNSSRIALGAELLEEICSHVDDDTLTRVARINKLFHDAAIRVLWRALDDVLP